MVVGWVIGPSYYSGELGLIGVNLLSEMYWSIARSVSSGLDSSALFIGAELRDIIGSLLGWIQGGFVLGYLLRVALLYGLLIVLSLGWGVVLVSDYSIGYSRGICFDLRDIINDLLVRSIDVLTSSIGSLIDNPLVVILLRWNVYLLYLLDLLAPLDIAWISIVITDVLLRSNLLSKSEEITLNFLLRNRL